MKKASKLFVYGSLILLFLCALLLFAYWNSIKYTGKNSSYLCLNRLRLIQFQVFSPSIGDFHVLGSRFPVGNPQIVSAEKVLAHLDDKHCWIDMALVADDYRLAVSPLNTKGKTFSDRWGSSFFIFGMSEKKWQKTPAFRWNGLRFPFLWDKRPDLNENRVNFLTIGWSYVETLHQQKFIKYLSAAKEWVEPEKVELKNLELRISNGDENERAFAIMMIGRKGDKKNMEIIKPFLNSNNRKLKAAAEYAKKRLEGK